MRNTIPVHGCKHPDDCDAIIVLGVRAISDEPERVPLALCPRCFELKGLDALLDEVEG